MDIIPPSPATAAPLSPAPVEGAVTTDPYHPLSTTLGIYAGWLLFWCGCLYILGGYQAMKALPFQIPLLDELITSPFILLTSLGAFLYLLLLTLHRALRGGVLLGVAFLLLGGAGVWLYAMNIR